MIAHPRPLIANTAMSGRGCAIIRLYLWRGVWLRWGMPGKQSLTSHTTLYLLDGMGWPRAPGGARLSARTGRCKHGMRQGRQAPRRAPHCLVVPRALECGSCASGPSDPDASTGGPDLLLSLAAGLGGSGEAPEDGPAGG